MQIGFPRLRSSPLRSSPTTHYALLDGMRGLASLFVVSHHLWTAAYGVQAMGGPAGFALNWLLYGHLAVDVFIVLSGFCLALPFARPDAPNRVDTWRFYGKRARRILPPYFAMLAISILLVVMARLLFGKRSGMPFDLNGVLANVFLLQDVFPDLNVFNGPFWSVAVETKIYFLFPLFVFVGKRFGAATMLVLAGVLGYGLTAAILAADPGAQLGHSCPWYVALFGMGMAAAFLLTHKPGARPGLVPLALMLLFAVLSVVGLQLFPITAKGEEELFVPALPYIDTAIGAFAATFLYWVTCSERAGERRIAISILSWRPLVFVGTFAYSLYLVHYPLVGYASVFIRRILHADDWQVVAACLFFVVFPLIVLASYLFFLVFERPFMTKAVAKVRHDGNTLSPAA